MQQANSTMSICRQNLQASFNKQLSRCISFFTVSSLVSYIIVVISEGQLLMYNITITRNGKKRGKCVITELHIQPFSLNPEMKLYHLDLIGAGQGMQMFLMSPSSETSIPSDSHELHAKNENPPTD